MLLCDTCIARTTTSSGAARLTRGKLRISGTWDFKWTPGTEIRVAVQELPASPVAVDFDKATALLKQMLDAWLPPGNAHLSYALVGKLPAPASAASARSNPSALAEMPYLDHDVLVSFAPLPTKIPGTSERAEQEVNFPRSELGTYATRKEYGVPTIFLGPHEGFRMGKPETWFDSAEGVFTVVHEIGHILGLAHEQQNPRLPYRLKWRPDAEMRQIAKLRNARTPPDTELDAFIAGEITEPWPGDVRFSDWRPPPVCAEAATVDFDSVMAKPVYRCFLADHHAGALDCLEESICPFEQEEFKRLSKPTRSDLDQLARMYPRL